MSVGLAGCVADGGTALVDSKVVQHDATSALPGGYDGRDSPPGQVIVIDDVERAEAVLSPDDLPPECRSAVDDRDLLVYVRSDRPDTCHSRVAVTGLALPEDRPTGTACAVDTSEPGDGCHPDHQFRGIRENHRRLCREPLVTDLVARTQRQQASESARAVDDYWAALDHVERRRLLVTLLDRERPVEMAVALAGTEPKTARRGALRDEHLPVLADLGLVDWDPRARRVAQGPAFERAEPLVRWLAERQDSPPEGVL